MVPIRALLARLASWRLDSWLRSGGTVPVSPLSARSKDTRLQPRMDRRVTLGYDGRTWAEALMPRISGRLPVSCGKLQKQWVNHELVWAQKGRQDVQGTFSVRCKNRRLGISWPIHKGSSGKVRRQEELATPTQKTKRLGRMGPAAQPKQTLSSSYQFIIITTGNSTYVIIGKLETRHKA